MAILFNGSLRRYVLVTTKNNNQSLRHINGNDPLKGTFCPGSLITPSLGTNVPCVQVGALCRSPSMLIDLIENDLLSNFMSAKAPIKESW